MDVIFISEYLYSHTFKYHQRNSYGDGDSYGIRNGDGYGDGQFYGFSGNGAGKGCTSNYYEDVEVTRIFDRFYLKPSKRVYRGM